MRHENGGEPNRLFGQPVQTIRPEGVEREYDWLYSAGVQHELIRGLGVSFNWYRRETYDLRVTQKTEPIVERVLNDITVDHKWTVYNSGADPHPIIKNEELILLRAEIRWNDGNRLGAVQDIDLVRAQSGGLGPSGLTPLSSDAAFIDELLYNRLYSLMWEQGTRWIDARRYGRIGALPIDRAGDVVHPEMLVPATECDARGLTSPCDP